MKDKYQAEASIGQKYGYVNYRTPEPGQTFDARFVAVLVPKKPWNRAPSYHIHAVRDDGTLGQRVEVIEFEEARHANA